MVEAVYDYVRSRNPHVVARINERKWEYFVPVQEGMPQNCSKDVSLVVDYVDKVLNHGNATSKTALKSMFGLENVEHDDDFAA